MKEITVFILQLVEELILDQLMVMNGETVLIQQF
jgi:hypothetical protein